MPNIANLPEDIIKTISIAYQKIKGTSECLPNKYMIPKAEMAGQRR
jgi:zona occludens toxin (predicted ATPase)